MERESDGDPSKPSILLRIASTALLLVAFASYLVLRVQGLAPELRDAANVGLLASLGILVAIFLVRMQDPRVRERAASAAKRAYVKRSARQRARPILRAVRNIAGIGLLTFILVAGSGLRVASAFTTNTAALPYVVALGLAAAVLATVAAFRFDAKSAREQTPPGTE